MLSFQASSRRSFLRKSAVLALTGAVGRREGLADEKVVMPFANGEREVVAYPQKRPLIRLTSRPPQLETPFSVFNEGLYTPNDAFFVRYHLAGIPMEIDVETFRVEVKGKVKTPLSLSVADLKSGFKPVEIVAVNQCSGNSRGFLEPRVSGGQLGNGAMGNARWKGVRLKDVLDRAGLAAEAKQVTFNGLDMPVMPQTPDFVKALEIDHARSEEVMLAYEMNGADLPMLNGYPLRLVVPGFYGTYWIKHLTEITVIDGQFDGFWMSTAYRIPNTPNAGVPPGTAPKTTVPIGRYNVRSFITSHVDGGELTVGETTLLKGIAFDGGSGIREVTLSTDGGRTWNAAELGQDVGKYSFREWTMPLTASDPGALELKVKATNRLGETQPLEPRWNPPGYMRNVVEAVKLAVN